MLMIVAVLLCYATRVVAKEGPERDSNSDH